MMRYQKKQKLAFTLIEMVISLSVGSILLIALGSTIALISQSVPQSTDDSTLSNQSNRALYDLSRYIENATWVIKAQGTKFKFKIPDRNKDGKRDVILIHYVAANKALYLSYNKHKKTILENINHMKISYNNISGLDAGTQITDVKLLIKMGRHGHFITARHIKLINTPKVK